MKVGKSMLVSEYFEGTVSNKPYKYQTKLNMVRCLKRLGLWHLEYAEITPNLCWERIDSHFNMNVKRVYAGYVRNIFNFDRKQIPIVEGQARNYDLPSQQERNYDLPSQQELHNVIERSKYRKKCKKNHCGEGSLHMYSLLSPTGFVCILKVSLFL
jgi:hypothetical protein